MGSELSPTTSGRAPVAMPIGRLQRSEPIEECLEAAADLAPAVARRVLARAGLALLQDAARTRDPERLKRLLDIQRRLQRDQHELAAASGAALEHLLAGPAGGRRPNGDQGFAEERADETAVIEHVAATVDDAVIDRRQALRHALNGSGRPLGAVADPLGPSTWLRALRSAMSHSGMDTETRKLLLGYFGQQLGPELAALSTRLCGLVRARGVAARPGTRPLAVFPSRFDAMSAERKTAAIAAGSHHRDGSFMSDPAVPVQPVAVAGLQAAFGSAADRTALRVRVADLLVSALATDERLAPAAAKALRGLRPHLLAAARDGDAFFADSVHPWRQVLAAFTRRAAMWPATHRSGVERFLRPLVACVDEIAGLPPGSEAAAARAMAALEQPPGGAHDAATRRRAALALGKAESRNVIARALAAEFGLRPDFAAAPPVLKRFLVGPWTQVMAAAVLLDIGEPDPGNHGRTAEDLLWAVQPGAMAQDPGRLARILPRMIANLRRGLRSIEHPEDETMALLRWLGSFCRRALPPGTPESDLVPLGPACADPVQQPAVADAGQPWLSPSEISNVHLAQASQLRDQFPGVAFEGLDLPATVLRAAGGLACGGIIEVRRRRRWERWAVECASRHAVLFLFSDPAGRLCALTAPMLASLMRAGAARIVSAQSLADATLDSLTQVALRAALPAAGQRPVAPAQPRRRRTPRAIAAAAMQEH